MADGNGCDQPQPPCDGEKPNRVARDVGAVQGYLEQRRAEKKQQTDADRAALSTARATWAIALLTIATIGVGISQFLIYKWQLDEMRATREGGDKSTVDQLNIMSGQLSQMNLAQRPWIKLEKIEPTSLTSDDAYGVSFWAKVIVSNVGHSPAQNVSVTADLLIQDFDLSSDEDMRAACRRGDTGSWIIPGRPIFPGQTQAIGGDVSSSWDIEIDRVRNARLARISSMYNTKAADGDAAKARAYAYATAKFPFFAPIALVGCINYRSPDNKALYQTSFMFDLEANDGSAPLPLLSGVMPVIRPPTPSPSDPEVMVVHPTEVQRIVRGNQIKLTVPLFSTFAN